MVLWCGYHGTSKNSGVQILESREFSISGDERDWLGRGVYFFQDDKHQAYMFAKFKKGKSKCLEHKDICVLKSNIQVKQEFILDLLCDEDRNFFKQYSDKLKNKLNSMPGWKHPEGFIVEFMTEKEIIYAVRAAYKVPKKNYNSFRFETVHVQICVKNVSCIKKDSICEVNCDAFRRI